MGSPKSQSSVAATVRGGVEHLARGVRGRLAHAAPGADPGDWLAVTVLADTDALEAAGLAAQLADLGPGIEVDVRPAPPGKGTEIAARVLVDDATSGDGDDSPAERQKRLRLALRILKSRLETGRVMRVDPQPAGRRSSSPAGKALDEAQAHGREQGVL